MITKLQTSTYIKTLLISSLLILNSCSSDDDIKEDNNIKEEIKSSDDTKEDNNTKENIKQQESNNKSMSLNFKAKFDGEDLVCSEDNKPKSYHKHHPTHTFMTIKDFRLFVSNIYLIDENGKKEMLNLKSNDFQYQDKNGSVVLLDFEDNTGDCIDRKNTPAMNKIAVGDIADKTYSKIEFTLGVPFHTNHTEYPTVKALNQPGMAWNWQAGRKFTKFESTNDVNKSYIFNLHLGSTGCKDSDANGKTDSCIQPNRVTVTLDFNPSKDEIIIDYAKLLGEVDITNNKGSAPGCMSKLDDPECSIIIPNFGLDIDAKNGQCSDEGCEGQKLFSVDTRN